MIKILKRETTEIFQDNETIIRKEELYQYNNSTERNGHKIFMESVGFKVKSSVSSLNRVTYFKVDVVRSV